MRGEFLAATLANASIRSCSGELPAHTFQQGLEAFVWLAMWPGVAGGGCLLVAISGVQAGLIPAMSAVERVLRTFRLRSVRIPHCAAPQATQSNVHSAM